MKTEDWISVKTDLPKIPGGEILSKNVWIYDEKYGQQQGYFTTDGVWYELNECLWLKNVTHWMPLPEDPPKEKTNNENDEERLDLSCDSSDSVGDYLGHWRSFDFANFCSPEECSFP